MEIKEMETNMETTGENNLSLIGGKRKDELIRIIKEEVLEAQRRLNARFLKQVRRRLGVAKLYPEDLRILHACMDEALGELSAGKSGNNSSISNSEETL